MQTLAHSKGEQSSKVSNLYESKINRLSEMSVKSGINPFTEIDWDDPKFAIDPLDPRWITSANTPLIQTDWFKSLPQEKQTALALDMTLQRYRVGIEFENILQRGFLWFANSLPMGTPEFRYIHHEVIEESYHSMMFYELIKRTGKQPKPIPPPFSFFTSFIVLLSKINPQMFFFFVLAGEEPIDYFQRDSIKKKEAIHPLHLKIMQIHVMEEARHVCFANMFLEKTMPQCGWFRKFRMSFSVPFNLALLIRFIIIPDRYLVKRYQIPWKVMVKAFYRNPEFHDTLAKSVASTRQLCEKVGLMNRFSRLVWKALKLA